MVLPFRHTSIYHQTWRPHYRMSIVVSSIVEVSMNKIALRLSVGVGDWTVESVIIANNVIIIIIRDPSPKSGIPNK